MGEKGSDWGPRKGASGMRLGTDLEGPKPGDPGMGVGSDLGPLNGEPGADLDPLKG